MDNNLTLKVKEFARSLGADLVGIANVERYSNAPIAMSPQGILPTATNVVVCAIHHLDEAIELGPEHISFYSLQIEEGTPFYDMYRKGEFDQVPDEIDREMYHLAIAKLKAAGYEHYEISNASKPGKPCRHNLKYWSMEDYLGIGSAASSYMQGVRFVEAPAMEFHQNDFDDETSEFVFTGLRKTCGICFDDFEKRYGRKFWDVFGDRRDQLEEYFEAGQLIETEEGLRLSEEGFDISNAIMAVFC